MASTTQVTNNPTAEEGGKEETGQEMTPIPSGQAETPMSPLSGSSDGLDCICEDYGNDMMTSSYTEISFDASDDETDVEIAEEFLNDCGKSPAERRSRRFMREMKMKQTLSSSLSLPQLSSTIVNWSERIKASYETENLAQLTAASGSELAGEGSPTSSTPRPDVVTPRNVNSALATQGIYTVDGNNISFVAHDLEEKLKIRSAPTSSKGSPKSSHSSTAYANLKVLQDLERQARALSNNLNNMLVHISEATHNITSLTTECMATYDTCITKTCDAVDANIKSMYQVMAKTEELPRAMQPVSKLAEEVKEVKRLLDLFEKVVD